VERKTNMAAEDGTTSLGFASQRFQAGVHICQIFGSDDERQDAVLKFLLSGLQAGECTRCFSEKVTSPVVARFLDEHGVAFSEVTAAGALALSPTRDVYFQGGRFDPDRMLDLLSRYHEASVAQGYLGARVIGEMLPEVQDLPGGDRLLEYEAKVSILLRRHPVTSVCQYDAHAFDGATILDILKVHPLMVVRGSVIHNPFFIPPEEFLSC
jgi:hypothetical protein